MKHTIILTETDLMRICAGDEVSIDIKQSGQTAIMSEERYKRLYEKDYSIFNEGAEKDIDAGIPWGDKYLERSR